MKSKEVLNILGCTRQTLTKYVKNKKIAIIKNNNGYYDYDNEDIYKLLSNNIRNNCYYTKLNKTIENYILYSDYHQIINDLLSYKIKNLIVYGYEIKDIDTLNFLCKKFGCNLEVR